MTALHAIVLLFEGIEELEALTPVDLLRRAGQTVKLLSVSAHPEVTGRNGIRLVADGFLEDFAKTAPSLVVVPGGPGHSALLANQAVLHFLRAHAARGGWLASICAGPLVLQEAGLLAGKRFTAFPGTAHLFDVPPLDEPVVWDDRLITSRGAGTAFPFALALVEALCGKHQAQAIAKETCYRG